MVKAASQYNTKDWEIKKGVRYGQDYIDTPAETKHSS